MPSSLLHAILGPGGVGGLIGAFLSHLGAPVTMVVRRESLAQFPDHLQLESPFGSFSAPVARSAEVPPCDVLWITVKATQLEGALRSVTNPGSVGAMVPLLNGIDHVALLRGKCGDTKIIPATIAGETERVAPGHIVHRSPFCRVNVSSQGQGLLGATLDALQKTGIECRFIDNEATLLWGKLVFLAPLALSTTAADRPIGGVLSDPKWWQLAQGCVREACAVALAEGATVDADFVIGSAGKFPPGMRSSMQKDVEQGNPPELDAIAGPILRGGARHGIGAPATKNLVSVIERKAKLSPSLV
jgi:2-dehydropantoate 2-reductase